jgi:hypothetical protein
MMGRSCHITSIVCCVMFVLCILAASRVPFLAAPGTKPLFFQGSPSSPRPATVPGSSDPTGDEWPMFRGRLNHSGMTMTTPVQAPDPLWTFKTALFVYSSPAVSGGRMYVGNHDGMVLCINATTGVSIWNYTTGGLVSSTPAVAGGRVYVGSYDTQVYCLDATTGALMWNFTTGGWVESAPAVMGGRVYLGSGL